MSVIKQIQINSSTEPEVSDASKDSKQKSKQNFINPKQTEQKKAVVEIRFLALSWLDEFEKEVFEGKTIDELIHGSTYE